jgi:hypothetical protein
MGYSHYERASCEISAIYLSWLTPCNGLHAQHINHTCVRAQLSLITASPMWPHLSTQGVQGASSPLKWELAPVTIWSRLRVLALLEAAGQEFTVFILEWVKVEVVTVILRTTPLYTMQYHILRQPLTMFSGEGYCMYVPLKVLSIIMQARMEVWPIQGNLGLCHYQSVCEYIFQKLIDTLESHYFTYGHSLLRSVTSWVNRPVAGQLLHRF